MDQFEEYTQVFIVRIWREPREIDGATPKWRGLVEHVTSGERRYVERLNEIAPFIASHLGENGPKTDLRWRIKHWLTRWRRT